MKMWGTDVGILRVQPAGPYAGDLYLWGSGKRIDALRTNDAAMAAALWAARDHRVLIMGEWVTDPDKGGTLFMVDGWKFEEETAFATIEAIPEPVGTPTGWKAELEQRHTDAVVTDYRERVAQEPVPPTPERLSEIRAEAEYYAERDRRRREAVPIPPQIGPAPAPNGAAGPQAPSASGTVGGYGFNVSWGEPSAPVLLVAGLVALALFVS